MPDIAYVGASRGGFASSTGAGIPGDPAGAADGDLLLCVIVTDTSADFTGAPPAGWTKVVEVDVGTDASMALYRKIRAGSEAGVLWSGIFGVNEAGMSWSLAYRNVDPTTPLDVAAVIGTESGTAWDAGPITPVSAQAMVVAFFGCDPGSDPYLFAWDAGITERIDSNTAVSGQDSTTAYLAVGDKLVDPPTSTPMGGDSSVTDTPAWIVIALRPAVVIGQNLRASADSVDGAWTDQGGGTALAAAIDEVTPADADFIQSPAAPINSGCRVKLTAGTDPATSVGHVIRWRASKDAGPEQIDMTVKLYQGGGNALGGGTLIAEFTRANVATGFVTFTETLSGAEADAITDYTDLYLEFFANQV